MLQKKNANVRLIATESDRNITIVHSKFQSVYLYLELRNVSIHYGLIANQLIKLMFHCLP